MLAYLNDRTRMPDGSFVPVAQPERHALKLAAAWPRWPWSSLVSAARPERPLPRLRGDATRTSPRRPLGIPKQSFTSGLFATGQQSGFYSPPGVDSQADLTTWFAESNKGEPETPAQRAIVDQLGSYHSAFGLPLSSAGPAPLLIQNGWTDDLFPAPEALRPYNDAARSATRALSCRSSSATSATSAGPTSTPSTWC